MKRIIISFISFIFALFFFLSQSSFSFSQDGSNRTSLIEQKEQSRSKPLTLSFAEVTELALKNSLDIQIARYDAYIKRAGQEKAESIFDTFFSANANYFDDKKDTLTTLAGSEATNISYSAEISKKLPTGTTLSLGAESSKEKTNSPFVTLNPSYESIAEVSVTQHLGSNFFGLADRSEVKISKLDIENSDFSSLGRIEQSLFQAQKAYLEFLLAEEELRIKKDMLNKAKELYTIYQDKFNLGTADKPELLAVEALLRRRISEIEVASLKRKKAKNNLFFLLNISKIEQKVKTLEALSAQAKKVDLSKALEEAIKHRRDYKQIKNELAKNDIQVAVKANALWPEIDLNASFLRNNIQGSYRESIDRFGNENNNEIQVGVRFKVPLENRKAKAELKEAKLTNKRNLILFKKIERLILKEINDKVNNLNSYSVQVGLNQKIVQIQKEKLAEEKKRLEAGLSSADLIIDYHQDLLGSRLNLAESFFDYRLGVIELQLAKNSLLDKYWQEPL